MTEIDSRYSDLLASKDVLINKPTKLDEIIEKSDIMAIKQIIACDVPVVLPGTGYRVNLDKGIVDIVIKLNEKGYKTTCCCAGHWHDKEQSFSPTWLAFDKGCLPPRPQIVGYERHSKQFGWQKYPCFVYGSRYNHAHPHRPMLSEGGEIMICYTQYKRGWTPEKKAQEHDRVLTELLDWAEKLPPCNTEECLRREYWSKLPIGTIDFENGEWDNYYEICDDPTIDLDEEFEQNWRYRCILN